MNDPALRPSFESELASIDSQIESIQKILIECTSGPAARKSFLGKIAELETRRADVQRATVNIAKDATHGTPWLAQAVRQTFEEAKQGFASIATS